MFLKPGQDQNLRNAYFTIIRFHNLYIIDITFRIQQKSPFQNLHLFAVAPLEHLRTFHSEMTCDHHCTI